MAHEASQPEQWLDSTDILIVDPPRKGLSPAVVDGLTRQTAHGDLPTLIVYVSCSFKSLRRDCDALLASNKWTLSSATAFLFFPGTDSIETLTLFTRTSVDK